jgi:hypothetical protein
MSLYLAEHNLTAHMPAEDAARFVYNCLVAEKAPNRWLKYWWSDDSGKMICLWEAQDIATVWDILRCAGIPTRDVFQVEEGDPDLFRQGLET